MPLIPALWDNWPTRGHQQAEPWLQYLFLDTYGKLSLYLIEWQEILVREISK